MERFALHSPRRHYENTQTMVVCMKSNKGVRSAISATLLTAALLTGCSSSQPELDRPQETEAPAPTQSENTEPSPSHWTPSTDVYRELDEACGTSLADEASVAGTGSNASANAVFVGTDADRPKVECILSSINAPFGWAEMEAGMEPSSPTMWGTYDGAWGAAGNALPLGTTYLVTLNLFFVGSAS